MFPDREVLQPTVVDPKTFLVWKAEAFELWESMWGKLYNEGSASRDLIDTIQSTFFLVHIIDHDFADGDIFAIFETIMNDDENSVVSSSKKATATSSSSSDSTTKKNNK